MGASVRPVQDTTPDEAEFQAWKTKRSAPAPAADVTPDEAEFQQWRARRGPTGDVDLSKPGTPNEIAAARAAAPMRMAPVVVSRPEMTPPTQSPRVRALPPTIAARDASQVGAPANPHAVQLHGGEKLASDVFSAGASAFEHPVETAATVATAPITSAAKAGLFLGQRINAATSPDANEQLAAAGVPMVSDKEALDAAAQLATMGFAKYARILVGRTLAPAVGSRAAGVAGALTEGAAVGASYDPENRARGAVVGGLLGGAVNEAQPYRPRGVRIRVGADAAAADASRALPAGEPPVRKAEARVVDEQLPAPREPDFTVEAVPDEAAFAAWQRATEAHRTSLETELRGAQRAAETDPLTGLANRAALDRALPAAEADPKTRVLLFDANNFGKVNKAIGHDAGDVVLKEMAGALSQAASEHGAGERVFRKGGDEFLVLAPDDVVDAVKTRAEEIFGDRQFTGKDGVPFTVSVTGTHGATFKEADAALQAAKDARKAGQTTPAGAVDRPTYTFKDVIQRPAAELRRIADEESAADKNVEVDLFGVEGAKRYAALQRRANSTMASNEAIDKASAEVAQMESALTEPQRNRLFGIGQEGLSAADLRDAARDAEYYDAKNANDLPLADLESTIGREMTTGSPHKNAAQALRLRGALTELQRRTGKTAEQILADGLNERVRRGHLSSPAQASELLAARLKDLREAGFFPEPTSKPTEAIADAQPKALPPAKGAATPARASSPLLDQVAPLLGKKSGAEVAAWAGDPSVHKMERFNRALQATQALRKHLGLEEGDSSVTGRDVQEEIDAYHASSAAAPVFAARAASGGESEIATAFDDWHSNRAYLDNAGNYRLKGEPFRPGQPVPGGPKPRAAIAPWNKAVKERYPDNATFHRAASDWAAGKTSGAEPPVHFARASGSGTPSAASAASSSSTPAAAATTGTPAVAAPQINAHLAALRSVFAPTALSPQAGTMGRIVREHAGANAHALEHAREAMKAFSKSFNRMPPAERLAFIDRMETGATQPTPELTKAAAEIRKWLDETRDEIRALGTGKLEAWIENYFPHIWTDPKAATSALGRILGKRPLEGPKSFLKHRTIPTTKDGIAAGLEPITDNPVDLTLLKLREMRRYLAAHRILQEAEAQGLVQYLHATKQGPDGYTRINDRIGTVYGKPTVEASEAFDKQIRKGLEDAIARLKGLTHERKPSTGMRGTLGYAKGADEMVSKFGSHDGVIMHELGHILDARYSLGKKLAASPATVKELTALAALRHETGTGGPGFAGYVQKPEEQVANALHALLHAPGRMATVAPTVKGILETFLASRAELKPILDIKPSLEIGTGKAELPVGGLVVRGFYYAPNAVARVLNNYLSPGLRGNAIYDAYQGINNTLNQAQLGLSAFHLGFTSMDAAVSQIAVGLQHLSHGRVGKGALQIVTYPAAPLTTFIRGSKLMKAYLDPTGASPELLKMVDAIVAAGGRARQDSFYASEAPKKFMAALRHAKPLSAARYSLPALFELAAKPIMEIVVPRQKLGVFTQLAERALADLPAGASRDDARKALGRAWDSVDNRLGQLVYDNLFWDKTMKDLAMASVRSVGWNLGTIRELGGGAIDLGAAAVKVGRGQKPELTERGSYLPAMLFGVGLTGAIMNYLMTGEGPKELKDYFFPRTGKTNVEGNDERVQLPSYMKDVVAYGKHPVQTLEHKQAPLISMLAEMLHNEDFYGDQLRNPDDPLVTQLGQEAKFLGEQLLPFGVRNAQESGKRVQDPRMKVGGFIGVTAAPRDATRSKAQNQMMQYLAQKSMRGGTPEQKAVREERGVLMASARQGTLDERTLDVAEEQGRLTGRQRVGIERAADGDADLWMTRFKRLDAAQALHVYKLATPAERDQYRDALEAKLVKAGMEDELDALEPVQVSSAPSAPASVRIRMPK